MTEKEITYQIRGAIYDTYRALGPGLLESVYEEVLVYFLQKRGLLVQRQVELPIEVDGIVLDSPLRMEIDVNSRRNLELCETMRTKEKRGSLLWVLDKTKSAPGARLLRQWVEHPLLKSSQILKRQSAVEELFNSFIKRQELETLLSGVLDLERLLTKIVYGTANAKDLRAVSSTISVFPEIKGLISDCGSEEIKKIFDNFDTLVDINLLSFLFTI